jgi:hypothetical protein
MWFSDWPVQLTIRVAAFSSFPHQGKSLDFLPSLLQSAEATTDCVSSSSKFSVTEIGSKVVASLEQLYLSNRYLLLPSLGPTAPNARRIEIQVKKGHPPPQAKIRATTSTVAEPPSSPTICTKLSLHSPHAQTRTTSKLRLLEAFLNAKFVFFPYYFSSIACCMLPRYC